MYEYISDKNRNKHIAATPAALHAPAELRHVRGTLHDLHGVCAHCCASNSASDSVATRAEATGDSASDSVNARMTRAEANSDRASGSTTARALAPCDTSTSGAPSQAGPRDGALPGPGPAGVLFCRGAGVIRCTCRL